MQSNTSLKKPFKTILIVQEHPYFLRNTFNHHFKENVKVIHKRLESL